MKIINKISNSFTRGNYEKNSINDINALINLNNLIDVYLPWSQSAIKPSILKKILNDILVNKRTAIAECGSGISTLYIASLIKQHSLDSAKFYSIDHNKEWINVLRSYCNKLDLNSEVQFIHAPLKKFENNFREVDWYDSAILDSKLNKVSIDQLIVDGPPAYKPKLKYSRYPAAIYFKKKIADNFSIFLDDTDRKAEKLIKEKWSGILNVDFHYGSQDKSVAIGIKGKAFNI
jgi:hypothetical protein